MIKEITKDLLIKNGACKKSLIEWEKQTDHGTLATFDRLVKNNPDWGHWLIIRLLSDEQSIKYAVYAAEQVLNIYESKFADDKRPRRAITAAKNYLKSDDYAAGDYAAGAAVDAEYSTESVPGAMDAAYAAAMATYTAETVIYHDLEDSRDVVYYTNKAVFHALESVTAHAHALPTFKPHYTPETHSIDNDARKTLLVKILKYGIELLKNNK